MTEPELNKILLLCIIMYKLSIATNKYYDNAEDNTVNKLFLECIKYNNKIKHGITNISHSILSYIM